jgi:nucleoside-diphosphate-sugar epimerase
MNRVLVTGANGFVGRAACRRLRADGLAVVAAMRQPDGGAGAVPVGDIDGDTDWTSALAGVDAVLHLAARVHVMNERSADPLAEFRRVNVQGTLRLAQQAVQAGVKRLVYVSSVKVNGEQTEPGRPFAATDAPAPVDPYGVSKFEAEQGLRALSQATGLELVIVRPPLVYGPGVGGNFARMVRWLRRGVPLPLGQATANRRSLVALDNLVDLLATCLAHPAAAGETFLVSDGEDLSTTELLRRLAKALDLKARLLPVPPVMLQVAASALRRGELAQRLLGSLQVDTAATQRVLQWQPVVTVDEALRQLSRTEVA